MRDCHKLGVKVFVLRWNSDDEFTALDVTMILAKSVCSELKEAR